MVWEDFVSMLSNHVVITHRTGPVDGYGRQQNVSAPVTVLCRVQHVNELFTNTAGEEKRVNCKVFVPPDTVVDLRDIVELETGEKREVQGVQNSYDEVGLHHKLLFLSETAVRFG